MNNLILNNRILPEVIDCGFKTATENFLHIARNVPFNILIYVKEGTFYVTEDNIDYEISSGEALFLKSDVTHLGNKKIKKDTSWYFIHFDMYAARNFPLYQKNNSDKNSNYCIELPKVITGLKNTHIEKSIIDFHDYYYCDEFEKDWKINMKLFDLLSNLAFCKPKEKLSISDNICKYLVENISKPFLAKNLENQFNLSYKHLAFLFKKEKNTTMQQFHMKKRMEAASKMLVETALSIGEIAEKLGFDDQLYFSRCFRQSFGVSPSDYRKKFLSAY